MTEEKLDQLSLVFRNIEAEKGASTMVKMAMEVIIDAAKNFQARDKEDFMEKFKEIVYMVKETKPRIALMIYYICEIWDKLSEYQEGVENVEGMIAILENETNLLVREIDSDSVKLVHHGAECVENGDTILVHSHSRVVLQALDLANQNGKKFRVVVAEQNEEKTLDIITFLQEKNISFCVVPEYMLSHVEKEVTKLFLGCVTFNDEYEFVSDAGTNSVVSEFHHADIPVYVFVTTKKFSLWKGMIKHHTHKIVQKKVHKDAKEILNYERIKFSHDRVAIRLIDKVVTEEGIYEPDKIKCIYDERFKEYSKWRERHLSGVHETQMY